ncbi:Uncharacterized protein Rs2_15320 [Raphanus sativus]|nr:Uncharacterized protein Rs2_15320 [Raphanus sativus]
MAKQTMVLKVPPMSEKSRIKTMKIVSVTYGVTGVWLEKEQGKLTVEGEGVDISALVQTLRKKVGYTDIIKVMVEGEGVDIFALVQTLWKKVGNIDIIKVIRATFS